MDLEACQRLKKLNWVQNQMDHCVFTLRHETGEGSPQICGALCLHVDDMLGAGDRSRTTYVEAERLLQKAFNFRTWDDDTKEITYCGTVLNRKNFSWTLSQESYIHKVKPVTVHRNRTPEEEMTERDRSQLRALLGSLQWPAVQSSPHLQCSCSLTAGKMAQNKLQAIVDFAKQNADIALKL